MAIWTSLKHCKVHNKFQECLSSHYGLIKFKLPDITGEKLRLSLVKLCKVRLDLGVRGKRAIRNVVIINYPTNLSKSHVEIT
jgi:hypothetical protein